MHLFKNFRIAHAEAGYKGNTVYEASSKKPWVIPVDGRVNFSVRPRDSLQDVEECHHRPQSEDSVCAVTRSSHWMERGGHGVDYILLIVTVVCGCRCLTGLGSTRQAPGLAGLDPTGGEFLSSPVSKSRVAGAGFVLVCLSVSRTDETKTATHTEAGMTRWCNLVPAGRQSDVPGQHRGQLRGGDLPDPPTPSPPHRGSPHPLQPPH